GGRPGGRGPDAGPGRKARLRAAVGGGAGRRRNRQQRGGHGGAAARTADHEGGQAAGPLRRPAASGAGGVRPGFGRAAAGPDAAGREQLRAAEEELTPERRRVSGPPLPLRERGEG